MPFAIDLSASARRHFRAAQILDRSQRRDVAGYLYGICAECAIKAMMREAGLRPLPDERRRDDPFYAHFPELRSMLRDSLQGRIGAPLSRFIADDSFMTQWNTDMRYSHGRDIHQRWIDTWAHQAHDVVDCLGT